VESFLLFNNLSIYVYIVRAISLSCTLPTLPPQHLCFQAEPVLPSSPSLRQNTGYNKKDIVQALYAHMNNKTIKKILKDIEFLLA
jgi:hypothetical protein